MNMITGAAEALAGLIELSASRQDNLSRPDRLPLVSVRVLPDLFQPRGGMDERHLSDLVKLLRSRKDLDPVTVMVVGDSYVLIDGHHRHEAYQRTGNDSIPTVYFEGTPEEAVLEAGKANAKAKLPMSSRERQDFAWRLVVLDRYSKAKVADASGTSTSQVATMRKAKRVLGVDAGNFETWFKARKAAEGKDMDGADEFDPEEWKQQVADRFADTLARTFSGRLSDDPEIAAMALAAYFGRRLPEVVGELQGFLPEVADEEF
ncbi:nuclease [Mesorhizobium sp. M4B.F.Ca.ET.215.01.1.1]|nr:nuclease [Mesorhizobium sp. M4B.F.Ca.ET.013.02.1.1]RVD45685.1 nuclease [Mesorhizobium sp. M4B.F.Ca.ET.019.03.1.1]TGQ14172.1 nuclease [Mesorhizobium sp. M4B.F.Ca.ET.215.01.1.1]TGQ41700.1 nuclease [Mesorhizobium sp. M4B.F.Ca.ET.214.01.1.1]TGQ47369.1 nuclease [Mesorhizobium sp. M00.F.Ca.ET.220.01.1.1]TGQ61627.1 nuclease [Mesorhizobium sp. M4B.F.Ca.ET.211.01.1.1]TGR07739.1 nuclease [Mesorhizobium sp. M4B.F.Ca.ET.203.01.1.1]TGU38399.1 nuclease [Mesorhizobium sp. M4B.F.Ca.ET.150.01.1.1]TIT2920